jgi:hypothetical protein
LVNRQLLSMEFHSRRRPSSSADLSPPPTLRSLTLLTQGAGAGSPFLLPRPFDPQFAASLDSKLTQLQPQGAGGSKEFLCRKRFKPA